MSHYCSNCATWLKHVDKLVTFPGTHELPEEFEIFCPECGSSHVIDGAVKCDERGCNDPVEDESALYCPLHETINRSNEQVFHAVLSATKSILLMFGPPTGYHTRELVKTYLGRLADAAFIEGEAVGRHTMARSLGPYVKSYESNNFGGRA